jgi:hypothetical protein
MRSTRYANGMSLRAVPGIIAHETTHALLDACTVGLLSDTLRTPWHSTRHLQILSLCSSISVMPEVLMHQIAAKGDLSSQNLLENWHRNLARQSGTTGAALRHRQGDILKQKMGAYYNRTLQTMTGSWKTTCARRRHIRYLRIHLSLIYSHIPYRVRDLFRTRFRRVRHS